MSLLGTRIGRIRLVDRLGKGGMGEVFAGYDETLDRRVAVKCVRVGNRPDKIKGRFLQEARILSRLDHPNICQIYDFVESDDRDFLVMELVEGKSLTQAVEAGLDDKARLEIAQAVADVLVAAHAEGVVHRDLKPEHVMITTDGDVKVLDFGIAHSIGVDEDQTVDMSSGAPPSGGVSDMPSPPPYRTVSGSLVGTPRFMSPEQARGEPVTPASDIYTFGLLLQELFTGERPYPRQPLATLLTDVAKGRSRPVTGLGRPLSDLIERMKVLHPSRRPTAKEVADRIRWIRRAPMRRLRRAAATAAILLAVGGVAKYTVDLEHQRSSAVTARDQAEDLAGFMLEDLAAELRPVGRLEVLEQVARKTLDYYERAGPGTGGAAAFRRGNAFGIVADVLEDQGDREAAVEAAGAGLEIHRQLVEANPERQEWRNQLALDYLRLGGILRLAGEDKRPQATEALETASAIASRLVEETPDRTEWRQTLAETRYGLGMFYLFHAGDAERARQTFDEAIAAYRRLAENDPSRLHFKYRLAVLHGQGLGQAYDELGREAESLAAIEQAYVIYEELTRADPANSRWQHGFAWENRRLGHYHQRQGRWREALEDHRRARAIGERLLSLEPANVDWQLALASDHSTIGAIHQRLGDPASARASFERALEVSERLMTIDPGDLTLEMYATALLHLGRLEDARPVVAGLRQRGWFEGPVEPELLELCERHGL